MKFRRNKILCTALLAGAIACGAMAAQTAFAVAEEPVDDTFAMMGASVRLNEPTGIRFGARLGVGAYDEATNGADTGTSVSYGVAIFPVDLLVYCGIDYAEYNPNLDYVSAITVKGAKYFEWLESQGETVVYETESVPVPVYAENDVEKTTPLYYEVYGSIGNVLYNNLARDFFGIAYQKTTTSEGDGVTVEYRYASFENGINVRSAAYVASAAYADTSDEDRELLEEFIGKAFCQKAKMTEEEADAAMASGGPEWTAALSDPSLELYVGGGAKLSAHGVYKDATIDLGASWTSGNKDVVSVDSTGAVKALKAGDTKITANVGGQIVYCDVTVSEREEAPYTVNVTGGTADKQKAAEDETVTLTVDETAIPEGKRFSHWTMDGETVKGNSFVMPARDVSVNAEYVTEFSTIEEYGLINSPQNFEGKPSEGDKVFTLRVDAHDGQQYGGEGWGSYVTIPYEGTQNTISFTLRNISSSHDLNLCIDVQQRYGGEIALSEATTGGTLENNNSQVKVTIPQNGSQRVSITADATEFDSGNKKVRIVLQPLAYEPHKYEGDIVLSEVLFGDAGSVLPESEYSVTVNGGYADKTKAKAGETVTLTPDPERIPEGMVPGGWMVNGKTVKDNFFEMPAEDVTVTAVYRFSYTISVTGGNADKTNAVAGDTVTLTRDPDLIPEGMVFGHWTVNGKTIEGDSFEMPAGDVTVTAVYVNDIGTTTVGNLYVVDGSGYYYTVVEGNTVKINNVCPSIDPDFKSVAFGITNYDPAKAKYVRVTVTNHSDAELDFRYKAAVGQEQGHGPDVSVKSGETKSWTGDARLGISGLTTAEIFFSGGAQNGTFTVTIEFSSTPFTE